MWGIDLRLRAFRSGGFLKCWWTDSGAAGLRLHLLQMRQYTAAAVTMDDPPPGTLRRLLPGFSSFDGAFSPCNAGFIPNLDWLGATESEQRENFRKAWAEHARAHKFGVTTQSRTVAGGELLHFDFYRAAVNRVPPPPPPLFVPAFFLSLTHCAVCRADTLI